MGVACLLGAVIPPPAAAQIGSGTDIITGTVTTPDGRPVARIEVEAYSLETQVTRRTRTDENGRYTILFTDGGGQYQMTARGIGFRPAQEIVLRHADEDRLVWNPQLTAGAVTMEPITVRARQAPPPGQGLDRPTPGSVERPLNPELIARLPIDDADLNLLATLVPGVVGVDATDSTAAAFSVAGLAPDANALTLDGLIFGSGAIPQDGLRQTRVVTSTYDAARGQFSGGLIAATTRSGSNMLQGSSQYALRDDDLSVSAEEGSAYTQGFTQHQLSAGLGGPIVRDRLFVFGSGQARLRSDAQQTLLTASADDYQRLGVHPDSVARFLAILDSLGIPRVVAPDGGRSSDNLSGMVRLDFLAANAHTVTLRGDWRGAATDPARLGPLAMPDAGGTVATTGGGGMLAVSSRFGMRLLNDARIYVQHDRQDGDPYLFLPQGRVQVASALSDGGTGVATLVFGGNTGLPTRSRTTRIEAADELSWLAGGGHRPKLGGLVVSLRQSDRPAGNQRGTFTYNALDALATDQAASFRRTLGVPDRTWHQYEWAAYAGDVWLMSPRFQLTYGVRLEGGRFGGAPAYNPAVEAAFGRRTDALPAEWRVSPRAGFTLSLGGSTGRGRLTSPPSLIIRGGGGEFRSPTPASLVTQAYTATGLDAAGEEITCIGPGVPPAEWSAFAADPGTVPDACLDSGPLVPRSVRTVTLFAPEFGAARTWRASLGFQKPLSTLFRLTLDGNFTRGRAQPGARDINLDTVPAFRLAVEGGRPVYVGSGDIAPATGAVRFTGSRVDSAFGHVVEIHSGLASEAWQATLGLGGVFGRGMQAQVAYTYQRARDQGSTARLGGGAGFGAGSGATTAGNPNVHEWARSAFERRHQFLLTFTYPFGASLEVTSIARLTSGAPYTPMVGSDLNGDGSRNDRAYLFPAGSGPEGDAIAALLERASGGVKDCLVGRLGTIPEHNACTGPWQGSLDFQINWRPAFFGLNRRLALSLVTVNFLRGLDELLHGADGARGWGINVRPDPTLLYVTGFDPVGQRYAYQVNDRFGATGGSASAFRPPFQIGFQARFTLGPDRRREALDALRGRGGGGGGGTGPGGGRGPGAGAFPLGAGTPDAVLARLDSVLPNTPALVLERRDSLRLTAAQIARLEAARDSFALRQAARAERLQATLRELGATPDPERLMPAVRPILEEARVDVVAVHAAVRAVLTDVQWAWLPETVRVLPPMLRRPGPQNR
jgi:hypothetical protein